MATRRYATSATEGSSDTYERIVTAAEQMVRAGEFHSATMDELAEKAGVSRATVFSRFGSRLGILEALKVRCSTSSEMQELQESLMIENPDELIESAIRASSRYWEQWGNVHRHLHAIVALEPEVRPLVADQRQSQREGVDYLVRRLNDAGLLAHGMTPKRAAITLHMLSNIETFTELRVESGLSLDQTIATITALARTLLAHDGEG
jgi:AcrR family transcriptional regulator